MILVAIALADGDCLCMCLAAIHQNLDSRNIKDLDNSLVSSLSLMELS